MVQQTFNMTVKQDYDTECATMTFGEEEIDWKVMNIKMTIDKTGNQHPSWVYTPLYTKDILAPPTLEEAKDDQYVIHPHPVDIVEESEEFETIAVSETFDVEEAEWKDNEAFRLTFDPTGKRNPQIQLVVMRTVPASQITGDGYLGNGVDVVDDIPRPSSPLPESSPEPAEADIVVRPATPVSVNGHSEIVQDVEIVEDEIIQDVEIAEQEAEPELDTDVVVISSEQIVNKKLRKHVGGSVRVKNQKIFDEMDESTVGTFVLPDINKYNKDIGAFIKDELIDIHMQNKLKINNAVNWWIEEVPGCNPLWPLWQQQDGKSFMRAVNFILFGFQDKRTKIRTALHDMLSNPNISSTVKNRWMYQMCLDQTKMGNSMYTFDHLNQRWSGIMEDGWCAYERQCLHSQEEGEAPSEGCRVEPIHVYLVANVLNRPIIVLTGTADDGIVDEELGGVYLPFEHEPDMCTKFPVLVGYSRENAHFAPLVTATVPGKGDNLPITIPITDSSLSLLPVHFAVLPDGEWIAEKSDEVTSLSTDERIQELSKYLHVNRVKYNKNGETNFNETIAVQLNPKAKEGERNQPVQKPEGYEDLLKNYTKGAKTRYKSVKKQVKCKTPKCKRMPSSQLNGVCYKCYYKISSTPNVAQEN